ncbi:MAG: YdcF family protein [Clostridia bacterium]|nr:YdcF family protein [Clostridia bacterium]
MRTGKEKRFGLGRILLISSGIILIADALFVMSRISMNLGVMLPLLAGIPLLLFGLFLPGVRKLARKSRIVRAAAFLVSLVYLLSALTLTVTTGLILFNSAEPEDGADALIVLGGGIRGRSPSLTLKYRLDAAKEYADRNPDALIVLSGGQGPDETVSEAEVMRDYLLARGVPDERMIMEDASVSTEENFRFSKAIIDERIGSGAVVVFVTNRFHVFRSELVARHEGLDAEGIPARGVWYITPNDYMRECVAIVVYFVKGKI